jgi:hypothetical protein
MPVSVGPGATALTRIPDSAVSSATDLVMPSTACLHVMRTDGSGDRALTNDISIQDSLPAWSPSGRRLAIRRPGGIWTVAADGSGLRRITRGSRSTNWDPSWQPR